MIKFEVRIKELVENYIPTWACWSNRCSLSGGCFANKIGILHRRLLAIVRDDDVC